MIASVGPLDVAGRSVEVGEHELAATQVDVVLMDVRMPGLDGIEATCRLLADAPAHRVVVMTTFDLDEHAHAALRAGASGILLKNTPSEKLVEAVRTLHGGDRQGRERGAEGHPLVAGMVAGARRGSRRPDGPWCRVKRDC